jgi:hypothetical protein
MKCEICNAETTLCITIVGDGGRSYTRWLCNAHAIQSGSPILPGNSFPRSVIPRIQRLSDYIRTNKRFPSNDGNPFADRLPNLADAGIAPDAACDYFDSLVAFIVKHNRLPTDDELDDPF